MDCEVIGHIYVDFCLRVVAVLRKSTWWNTRSTINDVVAHGRFLCLASGIKTWPFQNWESLWSPDPLFNLLSAY